MATDDIDKILRTSFLNELLKEGDFWRLVTKKGTFVDLIKLNFLSFQRDRNKNYLINIFNQCMKIRLLSKIEPIEIQGTLDDVYSKFNQENEFLVKQYDILFTTLQPNFYNYRHATVADLFEKIQYIKVLNQLELDSYSDDIFEEIMGVVYNILRE